MRKLNIQLSLTASLALSLGGCALFPVGSAETSIRVSSTLPIGQEAFVSFELGRASLRADNYASAIVAFSKAREEPELMAASLNGMGVAYAKLGRSDLAERYFRQAMSTAPDDGRFSANLARMLENKASVSPEPSTRLAVVEEPNLPNVTSGMSRTPPRITVEPTIRISAAEPTSQLTRVSQNEVRISVRAPETPEQLVQVAAALQQDTMSSTDASQQGMQTMPASAALVAELAQMLPKSGKFRASRVPKNLRAQVKRASLAEVAPTFSNSEQGQQDIGIAKSSGSSVVGGSLASLVSDTLGTHRSSSETSLFHKPQAEPASTFTERDNAEYIWCSARTALWTRTGPFAANQDAVCFPTRRFPCQDVIENRHDS